MKRIVLIFMTLIFVNCLTTNDGLALSNRTNARFSDEASIGLLSNSELETVTSVAFENALGESPLVAVQESKQEVPSDPSERTAENVEPQESKTGRIIMALFLTTLVVVCLSVMPMVMISRAAKTRKRLLDESRKNSP